MVNRLMGLGATAAFVSAAAFGTACSSSSSGGNSAESDGGSGVETGAPVLGLPEGGAWCVQDETTDPVTVVHICSLNQGGDCLPNTYPAPSCPTADLAGCCKGTAASAEGAGSEVCIYTDDYLDVDGGAEGWCTCTPPTSGCYGGTWQSSP
ncbi:MAG TPA: hypothetical protein VGL81_25360 [Polyangiaceae bacterium]|jgi:hypothetical protein